MIIASTASPAVSSQLIETALRAAAGATGMQLVFVSSIDAQTFTWRALHGKLDGISAGASLPLEETFCARLLAGAPSATADAALDQAYSDVPLREALAITSYVGVPLRRGGVITGTMGGLDSGVTPIAPADLSVLAALGRIVTAGSARDPQVRLRRTATGWEVEDANGVAAAAEDLTVAMSLADLIAAEDGDPVPPQRPPRPTQELSETDRLRVQISQLEHALSARVVIEQAIGVLSQRFSVAPREAFDRLRRTARSRGQRVHDLAVNIVRSARDETVSLPADLA
ncbi:MAG TPA: GAF and ANTAR domain-containing protein [Frankiaceae bacterium]|nr:GAF and ANTAR domain-containing protein [Frankiaceae bacterium]